MIEAGSTFEGKYVVRELLGEGGFAQVYRAFQPEVRRDVAIKIMHPAKRLGMHPDTLKARFYREARLAARLRDETNIRLLDFGESGDQPFMIFEYVDGIPLDALSRESGALPVLRVAQTSISTT